jgi:DNA-binding transcriptional LysR family regulator
MQSRVDWEDLRYVLAVAEANSLAAAAKTLGVHHTTVLRRVNAFEKRLGLRLFDRLPAGYALTAGGEELLASARAMSETITALERRVAGQDLRLEGVLRLTTTDTLIGSILPEVLAAFHEEHPGITLEVGTQNLIANLTKRDADVAIRPVPDPPETLVGQRAAGIAFAIYAARDYAKAAGDKDLRDHLWIAPDDSLAGTVVARWMRKRVGTTYQAALRADSLMAMCNAARAGIGAAVLPCFLGDMAPELVRLRPDVIAEMESAVWVLTHEDLRRTARVSAFMAFAAKALGRRRALFEGREPMGSA